MTLQGFLLGAVIATLVGALFHMWKGGNLGRLILYIVLSWIGFWFGHWMGGLLRWDFASVGGLKLGMALLGDCIILGVGYWLSLVQVEKK